MSDVMLFGVLKMPYEMAMASELSRMQFYQRVQQLVALVEAQQKQPKPQPEQEPVAGLHAVYFRNNWDGNEDLEYVLAYLSEEGEWTLHENGAPLIEFEGDEIIKTWPLTFESTAPPQPKPQPLTNKQIDTGRRAPWGINLDAFTAGVRFAEAAHGITGGAA